ncbi:hypothetical protein B5V88_17325 [Heyndrickxia sporothermodurans]|uniref:Uncharacterized protein n=1 Tax=Heyndrickxia sporothermodurans TaxID=46224 RepID=A0AB37H4R0_9BACI|nr:hypothetical protein [Heyndrickxia sporothermodurans]MBL5768716.1 hypothetical protein [Heyndrickxia sporothermodurans]MBL5772434.1 hypothetical protein [Heyndrickxia sporothermodurans]MBL5776599.1 hypothetical protein [Heyndrickxia sporothermodurans]MBL5779830.1 hypothetical protein [Heyndrickxia sporothermodurans]MBL5783567.1 hypothetical protein [Heyndrickxia sporothermodurans]
MNLNFLSELRNIRITLVVLTIVLTLSTCSRDNTQNINNDSQEIYPKFSSTNMIDFGNGDFGVLTSESDYGDDVIRIYHYDKKQMKLHLKRNNR